MEKKLAINRNSTDFPTLITSLLEKYILTNNDYDALFYYQQWARWYFEQGVTKGFVVNHYMGSGKTKTGLAIIDTALKHGIKKILYIAPTALEGGLEREVDEYNKLMGSNLDKAIFGFIPRSYTVVKNISKREDQAPEFVIDTTKATRNVTEISDKGLVVIDEAHLIMQSISNGSPGMVEFYDVMMNSPNINIVMLTGTIINSRPFELSPMLNLVSGERIFPETERTFMEAFWDREDKVMRNKNKFQNRAMGLISRIDTDAIQLSIGEGNKLKSGSSGSSMFPELLDPLVLKVPMSGRQAGLYMIRREKEIKDEMSKKATKVGSASGQKFERHDKESSTYMVRTRQCSNYAPPPEIESLYLREGGYKQKDIDEIMDRATPIELESPKFIMIDQIIRNHKRQKGIIYSQFTDIGGNGAFARYLQTPERVIESNVNIENEPSKVSSFTCCGYQLLTFDSDKKPTNLGPKTFALLNGSIHSTVYDKILKIYNQPENDHGELLPFLLIGTREGTGLDLKSCRYVVLMEVYFIYSFFIQLLYRARRHSSHLRLDPKERDVQPYILIATYPPRFTVSDYLKSQTEVRSTLTDVQLEKGLAATTDERMYAIMLNNRRLVEPFDTACGEISIECSALKRYFPDKVCRTCAPDGMKLYTEMIKNQSPEKLLNYDLREADPCQEYETEKVEAKKVTVKTSEGDIDYYYVNDTSSPNGYGIYYHDKDKNLYEELFPSSPAHQLVLNQINKK